MRSLQFSHLPTGKINNDKKWGRHLSPPKIQARGAKLSRIVKETIKRIKSTPVIAGFLLFGLTISMLMISFATSFVAELMHQQEDKREHKPPHAFMFRLNLNSENRVPLEDLVQILGSVNKSTGIFVTNIMMSIDKANVDESFSVSAEWFAGDTGWSYPLAAGKYYTIDDIKKGSKVVLIGRNLEKYVEKRNSNRFIKISGEEYKVLGTVGFKEKKSLWDTRIFMPLTSLPELTKQTLEGGNVSLVMYNVRGETRGEIEKVGAKAREEYAKAEILNIAEIEEENVVAQVVVNPDILLIVGILSYIISVIYVINMVSFWIEKRSFEIGVRKAFGHTDFSIAALIFREMLGIAVLAFVLSLIIQTVLGIFVTDVMGYTVRLYIENIAIGLAAVILTAIITSTWPVMKSLKIQPVESMKL